MRQYPVASHIFLFQSPSTPVIITFENTDSIKLFVFHSTWKKWKTEQNFWNQRRCSLTIFIGGIQFFYYRQRALTLEVFSELFELQKLVLFEICTLHTGFKIRWNFTTIYNRLRDPFIYPDTHISKNRDRENVGQGYDVQHSQWSLPMANT